VLAPHSNAKCKTRKVNRNRGSGGWEA
jgi:hypothetical protein